MITLAFDTATPRGVAALLRDETVLAEVEFGRGELFGALTRLPLKMNEVELLAVGVGPGSFTGIRAGIAAAKGLALPRNIPIQPVSTFDAMVTTHQHYVVACDARRGEFYCAEYAPQGRGEIQVLASLPANLPVVTWEDRPGTTPVWPSATALGRVALRRERLPLEPIYLRTVRYRTTA
jgi:tRNA threonylcarbamoyladenosine biosynthesis protein TsaB